MSFERALLFDACGFAPALLFTYLFVIDLGLLALTLIESSLITVQAFAVCSMTQGAILVAFAAGSGELP